MAAEEASVRRDRDVDVVVERLAEHRPAPRLDAHDAQLGARRPAASGRSASVRREEPLAHVHAEDADRDGVVDLVRQEEAAVLDRLVLDAVHVGGDAGDLDPEDLLAAAPQVVPRVDLRPDLLARAAAAADRLEVVPLQALVAAVHPLPLLLGEVARVGHARDHEVVDAEDLGHALDHVGVHPADRRADDDHGGDADDDPDQREEGAQLVREDRLERDADRLEVEARSTGVDRADKETPRGRKREDATEGSPIFVRVARAAAGLPRTTCIIRSGPRRWPAPCQNLRSTRTSGTDSGASMIRWSTSLGLRLGAGAPTPPDDRHAKGRASRVGEAVRNGACCLQVGAGAPTPPDDRLAKGRRLGEWGKRFATARVACKWGLAPPRPPTTATRRGAPRGWEKRFATARVACKWGLAPPHPPTTATRRGAPREWGKRSAYGLLPPFLSWGGFAPQAPPCGHCGGENSSGRCLTARLSCS